MGDTFGPEPDPQPFERVAQIAIALTLAMIGVRLFWLWFTGTIKSEPFLGSAAWKAAIAGPGALWIAAWQVSSIRRRRAVARRLQSLTAREPMRTWHRRIANADRWLELGVPIRTSPLVAEIADRYPALDDEGRRSVRALWRAYPSFGEAPYIDERPTNVDAVRRALMLFSIRDQRRDARDEVVGLDALAASARAAGIDFATLAHEAAMLSEASGQDQMFGSTRELLMRYAGDTSS